MMQHMEFWILPEAPESWSPPWTSTWRRGQPCVCTALWGLHAAPSLRFTPVWGMWTARQGEQGEKNGFGWRSEQQQPLQMQLFTLFSHSEEQRAGGCQQLSGTTRLPCSPAWPIQGLEQTGFHFTSTEHLYSDGKLCQQPVRRSWRKEGRQYPPLVTACEASLGDTAKSSTSSSAWMQQMGTNWWLQPSSLPLNRRHSERGLPVLVCNVPVVRAAYCPLWNSRCWMKTKVIYLGTRLPQINSWTGSKRACAEDWEEGQGYLFLVISGATWRMPAVFSQTQRILGDWYTTSKPRNLPAWLWNVHQGGTISARLKRWIGLWGFYWVLLTSHITRQNPFVFR